MRTLPSLLLLCGGYGGTAIEYGSLTGQYGLDYCIAEADTTSDMTASTTMAAPTCTLPWTSLAPYMSATTWAPGVCEHNPMRDEGSEQCTRPASLSPSESTICFDDPFFDFFLAICRLQTRTSEDTCASTHTTSPRRWSTRYSRLLRPHPPTAANLNFRPSAAPRYRCTHGPIRWRYNS